MATHLIHLGGFVLVLLAIALGIVVGRVIEGIGIGIVLYALWTRVWRAVGAHKPELSPQTDRPVA